MASFWVSWRAGRRVVQVMLAFAAAGLILSGMPGRLFSGISSEAIAQPNDSLAEVRFQLSDLERFPLFLPASQGTLVAASNQVSPLQISQPSLIWVQDQLSDRYGSDRLIGQWQAYQIPNGLNYVDVIVSEPIWNLLNYFERYAFILKFGTAARDYGYNLRLFHSGDAANSTEMAASRAISSRVSRRSPAGLVVLRGAHFCRFGNRAPGADATATPPCNVVLDESSQRPPINRPF